LGRCGLVGLISIADKYSSFNIDICDFFLVDSTNSDNFALPMGVLVEAIYGNAMKSTFLPGNVQATAPTQPLAMNMLDSLTVHAKMRFVCFC
jgi:hypothetical protein